MALEFVRKTGKPVKAWCFVKGASPNRIFYTYEYPELQKLESAGVVKVYCATKPDADWTNLSDWTQGTNSAACLKPSAPPLGVAQPVNVNNRK